jgi:hypothetical protein
MFSTIQYFNRIIRASIVDDTEYINVGELNFLQLHVVIDPSRVI